MTNTIAIFQISTEEDLRFQLDFVGLVLSGRTLRVNVRERDSNDLKVSLIAPANLTLVGTGNLTVSYPKASMSAWATGEYEADVVDETGGRFTRIMAVRFVYDEPGKLVYGVKGNQATVSWGGNQAVVTAIGGVGPPGPVNVLAIGTVTTLETGEPATAAISGDAPTQTLDLGLPKGETGDKGWAPVFGLAADGERFVFVLSGWAGGEGPPPPVTSGGLPLYVGASGLTTDIGSAFDTRGRVGDKGDQGDKGWSPAFAIEADGARRVLRVVDWVGGAGGKPATGDYVGATGLTPTIGDAIDFRGPPGTATIADGDKGDITTSDDGDTWLLNAEAVANLAAFAGDAGSGGSKGLVPAPAANDADSILYGDGTWKKPAADLISQGSLPASDHIDITLPAGYDEIRIELIGFASSVANAGLGVQVSTDGVTFLNADYAVTGLYTQIGGSAPGFTTTTTASSVFTGLALPLGGSSNSTIRLRDYARSGAKTIISAETDQFDNTGQPAMGRFTGSHATTSPLVKCRVIFTSGASPSFAAGAYKVYGLKKQ